MNDLRIYYHRGTSDCPIAIYHNRFWGKTTSVAPHWHTDAEIFWMESGTMLMGADERSYTLSPGEFFLLEPGCLHSIHQASPDAQWWQVIFAREAITLPSHHIFEQSFVQPLYEGQLRLPRMICDGHPLFPTLTRLFGNMKDCSMGARNYKLMRFSMVVQLCAILMPWCSTPASKDALELPDNNAVKKAAIYIHNNLTKKLQLEKIAKHVHLHPNYLCALFKHHMGETLFQHIARTRVEYATTLLRNEELSISQVAEQAGFASSSLFFKKFKEFTGLSPLNYAKQNKLPPEHMLPTHMTEF